MPTPADTNPLAEKYAREAGALSGLITRALIALRYGNTEAAVADLEEGYRVAHHGEQFAKIHPLRARETA